ncbi:Pentatricopeptide repeat-containing protein [Heracleum sosnowskyi]|uniref:Pentatricopeptide repeat-containing protein n=1 Tax=Heracleum sosnowskyi TaxID=360622 RepID=A0AAD8N5L0_9APIA|nr:Pentatricopeptide repeat-containing protein [Heracleum sosnowskyi]
MGTAISTIRSNSTSTNLHRLVSSHKNYYNTASATRSNMKSKFSSSGSNALFQKISTLRDPDASIVPILDEFMRDGKKVKGTDLQRFVRELRSRKRLSHALQLSEWVNTNNYCRDTSGNHAVQLDLIGSVRGIDAAENYFNKLTGKEKDERTYGALLNCYTREGLVDKSLSLKQTMKEAGFVSSPLAYNNLMCLYSRTDQPEKVLDMLSEMKQNGISPNNFSYRFCINACGEKSDFKSMEKLLAEMENQPQITMDWSTYSTAVNHYIIGDQKEKARVALKKLETLNKDAIGYSHLISHYAKLGDVDEVMRLWGLQKVVCKKQINRDYITMLGMLVKLGELEEGANVLMEWESSCRTFDFRVPNVLFIGLCSKGLTEKAETMLKKMIGTGKRPIPNSWAIISFGYMEMKNLKKAYECMKEALAVSQESPGWKPKPVLISSILRWLGENGKIADVEAFVSSLRSVIPVNREMYHALIKANARCGNGADDLINRMKSDKIDADEETKKILSSNTDGSE